jgi:hypothetical protein
VTWALVDAIAAERKRSSCSTTVGSVRSDGTAGQQVRPTDTAHPPLSLDTRDPQCSGLPRGEEQRGIADVAVLDPGHGQGIHRLHGDGGLLACRLGVAHEEPETGGIRDHPGVDGSGCTEFARIRCGASSIARDFINPTTPCLAAL